MQHKKSPRNVAITMQGKEERAKARRITHL